MRKVSDYSKDYITNGNPWNLGFKLLGVFVVVILVIGGVTFGLRWLHAGAEVVSPQNVKAQWQFAYDYHESLQGIAGTWCSARQTESETTDPTVKTQLTQQRLAHENNYRRVQAEYNGRLADAFRAKLVKPSDVPTSAPTLAANLESIGCTAPGPFPVG